MLKQEERAEIEAEVAHYEYKRAASIEALKILQRHRGWISDETLHDLAPLLPMVCLGACDHAPVMMIDEELHTDLNESKVDTLL